MDVGSGVGLGYRSPIGLAQWKFLYIFVGNGLEAIQPDIITPCRGSLKLHTADGIAAYATEKLHTAAGFPLQTSSISSMKTFKSHLKSHLKSLGALALVSVTAGLTSCSSNSYNPYEDVDLIPVQLKEDGKWSFINPEGEIVYDSEFKNAPSWMVNGVFAVEEKEGYTLYTKGDRSPKALPGCDKLVAVGYLHDGVIPVVKKQERISLVDKEGKKIAELAPVGGKEIVEAHSGFSEERLAIKDQDGKWGYVDPKGNVVIKPKYNGAYDFSEDLAVAGILESDSTDVEPDLFVIDKNGNQVFKIKSNLDIMYYQYKFGRLLCQNDNEVYVFLDKKGEQTKLPSKVKGVSDYNDSYIIYRDDNDEYGVINMNGEVLIRAKYESITFAGDYFIAVKDEEPVLLDNKGEEKHSFDDFKSVAYLYQFGYLAGEKKTSMLLDEDFKQKGKEEFYNIGGNGPSISWRLESDYFDVAGPADAIAELITDKGAGKYLLGAAPSSMFSNPSDYLWTSSVDLTDLRREGYKWILTAKAQFTNNLADYDYDYNFDRHDYWRSDSKLGAIMLNLSTEKEFGTKGLKAIVEALKKKGFKQTNQGKSGDEEIWLLKNSRALVAVGGDPEGRNAKIAVGDSQLPALESEFNSILGGSSDYASEAAIEAVDTVAAR